MDIARFWDIIETVRASAGPDKPFHESLIDHLATLTEDDILEYYEPFEAMREALYPPPRGLPACPQADESKTGSPMRCSDDGFPGPPRPSSHARCPAFLRPAVALSR
jgi:hypothetical protein